MVADSFRKVMPTQLEPVMLAFKLTMASYATDLYSREKLPVEGEGFVGPPVLNPNKLSHRSAH